MLRVLIADDHALIREGVKQLVAKYPSIGKIGETASGLSTLQRALEEHWDLLLLDLNMPGMDGFEVLRRLRQDKPRLPVLVISLNAEETHARRAFKAGANGYIMKDCEAGEIQQAISQVLRGQRYVSRSLAQHLLEHDGQADGPMHERLSEREQQIFDAIIAGRSLKEVALVLDINEKTVSTYRSRLLEKMGLRSNADLIRYALEHGLLG